MKARVTYLTSGDYYDFEKKKVTSAKPLIVNPYHNVSTDSSDILSSYQTTKLITRLVDQKPLYNIGLTRTPTGFPSRTPTFSLKFYRDEKTKGYLSDHKYAAESVLVDFKNDYREGE